MHVGDKPRRKWGNTVEDSPSFPGTTRANWFPPPRDPAERTSDSDSRSTERIPVSPIVIGTSTFMIRGESEAEDLKVLSAAPYINLRI